jgi:guanylate kinase
VDYHFISVSEFLEKEHKGYFIETTLYNGNYYGTSIEDVSDKKVLIVDIIGANKFYERLGDKSVFFFLSCSDETTKQRMEERGDSENDIIARINGDKVYFNPDLMQHVDFYINTDNISLEEVTDDIYHKYMQTLKARQ